MKGNTGSMNIGRYSCTDNMSISAVIFSYKSVNVVLAMFNNIRVCVIYCYTNNSAIVAYFFWYTANVNLHGINAVHECGCMTS